MLALNEAGEAVLAAALLPLDPEFFRGSLLKNVAPAFLPTSVAIGELVSRADGPIAVGIGIANLAPDLGTTVRGLVFAATVGVNNSVAAQGGLRLPCLKHVGNPRRQPTSVQ